jgi:hypothetical protein
MAPFAPGEAQRILADVRANLKRLDSCEGPHRFDPIPEDVGKVFGIRYRCTLCGGEVDNHAKHWYERGLKHAVR